MILNESTILGQINSPKDLKNLSYSELNSLCAEIRNKIINVTTTNGGHLASNLGTVELTVALHKVLNLPFDAIVWDVGHQSYTHKLLTGRASNFDTLRLTNGISGFPRPTESEYDSFIAGHASNSISAALGLLTANKINKNNNKVIAVIGDGALTGGLAFEGLNHAGYLKENLIIILNDNNMSINKNIGALAGRPTFNAVSAAISRFSVRKSYQTYTKFIGKLLLKIPFFGNFLFHFRKRIINGLKAIFFKESLFSNLGFEYIGPINGHNIKKIVHVLNDVTKLSVPVVLHVRTVKGKGVDFIESNPEDFHGVSANTVFKDGKIQVKKSNLTWTELFSEKIVELGKKDKKIVALTAAMTSGTGLNSFKNNFPDRFFDTGIAEEHATVFAAGLAKNGLKPFVAIYSTFIQRAIDQIIHDVSILNLPVVFVLDRAGLVSGDGETHQGIFDLALLKSIPNLEVLLPSSKKIFCQMLDYCRNAKNPIVLRIPKDTCYDLPIEYPDFTPHKPNFIIKNKKSSTLIISCADMLINSFNICTKLNEQKKSVDLLDILTFKPLDEKYFIESIKSYKNIYFIEDGIKIGSVSESLSALIAEYGFKIKTKIYAIPSTFPEHSSRNELLDKYNLSVNTILKDILKK